MPYPPKKLMRFLANENFPLPSVIRLRQFGHDVAAIAQDSSGAKDHQVMTRGVREGRVILTFDRDYGELIYRLGLPPPAGVVYFRYDPPTPAEPAMRVASLISIRNLPLEGKFTVVQERQVRQRPLSR